MTMGASAYTGAAGVIAKKVGVRLAISTIKKAAFKAIIPLIKEKVIKWTAQTLGVLKMFVENIVTYFTSMIISMGIKVINTIIEVIIEPIKQYVR
jgi:hypothetical protein